LQRFGEIARVCLYGNDADVLKELQSINNRLDSLQTDVKDVKQVQMQTNERLSKFEVGQTHLATAVEVHKVGQDDIRQHMATKADVLDAKAAILHVGAKLDKYQWQNEVRLDNLEEITGTHNPNKN
jgi:hypothetical protein